MDEYERFEITEEDLQNEFSSKRRRGLTKEQQIYGMFADNSDNEGEPESQKYSGSSSLFKKGGLNFVAGGIQQSGKKEQKEENIEDEKEFDEYNPKPMFKTQLLDSSDEDVDNEPLELIRSKPKNNSQSLAGLRKSQGILNEGNVGDWEKHTSGIGSKLMKMMGYKEGKGLGKDLQGIAIPVEAHKRKGKGAIGFYGTENKNKSIKELSESASKSAAGDETDVKRPLSKQWKKTGNQGKTKYVYKTAEEVISEGRSKKSRSKHDAHITGTKVIDMTGPEMRVLSSYRAIAGQKVFENVEVDATEKKYEYFDLPELIHNLDLLIEKSEESIVHNAKTLENEENKVVHLNHERERYEVLLEKEEKELKQLDQACVLIETLESKFNDKTLNLDNSYDILKELQDNYNLIYNKYEIQYLAPSYLLPLFKEVFSHWVPLNKKTSEQYMDLMRKWRPVLEKNDFGNYQPGSDTPMDPYHQIIWETWASCLRAAVMALWDPRDCSPLLTVCEKWAPLIPEWIQSSVLQCVVLPRITKAVNEWNPMKDTVPIHTWLHPWLPLLADNLQAVYPLIRQKLSAALVHWHPSDRSAKMVLQPWKNVFSEMSMTTLIQISIQPKLEAALMEYTINPLDQKLDVWSWFVDWQDFFPGSIMSSMLDKCFFPKWYQALGSWLTVNPPYIDVIAWYKGWRELFPINLRESLPVKQKFQQALEICQRALSFQAGASDKFNLLINGLDKIGDPPPPPPSPPKNSKKDWADIINLGKVENLSMRELVEKKCHDKGVVFYPIPDKKYEGRPVYKCGRLNISFNKHIIYVQSDKKWAPKSLKVIFDDV